MAVFGACAVVVSGCSVTTSPEARSADHHALIAQNVMTQGYYAVPATDAARRVVGRKGDTTIEALSADGTNRAGRIVLRITVDTSNGSEFDSSFIGCYEYAVNWLKDQIEHHRISNCPNGPALTLTTPHPPDLISAAATTRLLRVLKGVPLADRRNETVIQHAVASVFGPPSTVGVAPTNGPDLQVTVRGGNECVFALVPPSAMPTLIGTGTDLQCQA